MKAIRIEVSGKVQGVYYRASTVEKARELGIKGTVQNLPNGQVLVFAEGNTDALEALKEWCKKGPILAWVKEITVTEIEFKGYSDFVEIR